MTPCSVAQKAEAEALPRLSTPDASEMIGCRNVPQVRNFYGRKGDEASNSIRGGRRESCLSAFRKSLANPLAINAFFAAMQNRVAQVKLG